MLPEPAEIPVTVLAMVREPPLTVSDNGVLKLRTPLMPSTASTLRLPPVVVKLNPLPPNPDRLLTALPAWLRTTVPLAANAMTLGTTMGCVCDTLPPDAYMA